MERGTVVYDPDAEGTAILRYLAFDAVDGNDDIVRRVFAAAREHLDGRIEFERSLSLFDFALRPAGAPAARTQLPDVTPDDNDLVTWARQHLFERAFHEACEERAAVANIQDDFVRRSFGALIVGADEAALAAEDELDRGVGGAEGRLRKAELTKETYEVRLEHRLTSIERSRAVTRGAVSVLGTALVLPLASTTPASSDGGRLSDPEIERIAVDVASRYETEVRKVDRLTSVEADNVGFDLLSLRSGTRRCIEVKGRAGVALVELTWGEFSKSQELGEDYWLYVVLDCAMPTPRLYRVQDPARTLAKAWTASHDVRFRVRPEPVIAAGNAEEES